MKNSNVLIAVLLLAMIASVTTLAVLGKDVDTIIQFFVGTAIPSAIAFYGARKAEKAEQNTNGRLSQLIDGYVSNGQQVPPGYEDVRPDVYVDESAPTDVDDDHPVYPPN